MLCLCFIVRWLKTRKDTKNYTTKISPSTKNKHFLYACYFDIWATTCDFQQCGILTSVDSIKPVQPPFKHITTNGVQSVAELSLKAQVTSKGSDQTARMRRLVWAFTGRTYHIVGNLVSRLIFVLLVYLFEC